MNKTAAYEIALFSNPLWTKEAKLKVRELEQRHLDDMYLPEGLESDVQQMLDAREKESFALRHPYLTGIPTLGIAPSIAAGNAYSDVHDALMRKHPQVRQAHKSHMEELRKQHMKEYKAETKRLQATQAERAVGKAGQAALAAIAMHHSAKSPEKQESDNGKIASVDLKHVAVPAAAIAAGLLSHRNHSKNGKPLSRAEAALEAERAYASVMKEHGYDEASSSVPRALKEKLTALQSKHPTVGAGANALGAGVLASMLLPSMKVL